MVQYNVWREKMTIIHLNVYAEEQLKSITKNCLNKIEEKPWHSLSIFFNHYSQVQPEISSLVHFIQKLDSISGSRIFLFFLRSYLHYSSPTYLEFEALENFPKESPAIHMLFAWLEQVSKQMHASVELCSNAFNYMEESNEIQRAF